MPLGEIAGEVAGAIFRFMGHLFGDLLLEVAIKGLGFMVCRLFSSSVDADGALVIVVGILAWIAIVALCIFSYGWIQA